MKHLLLLLILFVLSPLFAQQAGVSKKVNCIAKRIASLDVLMVPDAATLGEQENRFANINPQTLRVGNTTSSLNQRKLTQAEFARRGSSISYNDYLFFRNRRSSQLNSFRRIDKHATLQELELLCDHKNPVVRSYAFWSYLDSQPTKAFPILKEHLKDNERVRIFRNDDVEIRKVGDLFIDLMTEGKIDYFLTKMTPAEKAELDELILADDDISLAYKSRLLSQLPTTASNYDQVRNIAINNEDDEAIIKLAGYQKRQDIPVFEELLRRTGRRKVALKSVRVFPADEFWNKLVDIHTDVLKEKKPDPFFLHYLYQALVQYPEELVHPLLTAGLADSPSRAVERHREAIWLALHKYPNPSLRTIQDGLGFDKYEQRRLIKLKAY